MQNGLTVGGGSITVVPAANCKLRTLAHGGLDTSTLDRASVGFLSVFGVYRRVTKFAYGILQSPSRRR